MASSNSIQDVPKSTRDKVHRYLTIEVPYEVCKTINADAPAELDLTRPEYELMVRGCADLILKVCPERTRLEALRERLVSEKKSWKYFTHLAVILAVSKSIVNSMRSQNVHFTCTFAVYGETRRILTKAEDPNGEDFLRTKNNQLNWLTENAPSVSWGILVVDDGCPDNSGQVCADNAAKFGFAEKVEVIRLQDGIDQGVDVVVKGTPITKTSESRKGGSIHYALNYAAAKDVGGKKHVVCYTDADLSTHMGQSGLLLDIICNQGKSCAVGSRRAHNAIMEKSGGRAVRGKLHAYFWKQMMPEMVHIIDTQTAFKAFDAEAAQKVTQDGLINRAMAFDIELLIKTATNFGGDSLGQAGIAWKDSEALSTSGDSSGYVKLLQQMVDIYRNYLTQEPWREEFGNFIYQLEDDSFERLLKNCPPGIAERDAADYKSPDIVSVAELSEACGISKK
eukprot:CAMPEP_0117756390 /NCGR_PEP_ID=MMETSP0947-20121206/14049_1 /TAXON_ID=44440 /ORGANISM="Chattonella subsalsa, Strain CCMP2191" /LENGTH=450 /DNA_ID=CAMNT_0005575967 /DNA_START=135 /DNA_END=1487 /DNA_ORIENTATION=+